MIPSKVPLLSPHLLFSSWPSNFLWAEGHARERGKEQDRKELVLMSLYNILFYLFLSWYKSTFISRTAWIHWDSVFVSAVQNLFMSFSFHWLGGYIAHTNIMTVSHWFYVAKKKLAVHCWIRILSRRSDFFFFKFWLAIRNNVQ